MKTLNRMCIHNPNIQLRIGVMVVLFLLGHLGLMTIAPAVSATSEIDAHHVVSIERCDAADEDMNLTGSMPGVPHVGIAVSFISADLFDGHIDVMLSSVAPVPDATAQRVASQLFLN